jgi:hypothetical protein
MHGREYPPSLWMKVVYRGKFSTVHGREVLHAQPTHGGQLNTYHHLLPYYYPDLERSP